MVKHVEIQEGVFLRVDKVVRIARSGQSVVVHTEGCSWVDTLCYDSEQDAEDACTELRRMIWGLQTPEQKKFRASVQGPELVKDQPAELREWWVELTDGSDEGWSWKEKSKAIGNTTSDDEVVHVREVPSPERVRAALYAWAATNTYQVSWDSYAKTHRQESESVLALLRSLGVPTEGV